MLTMRYKTTYKELKNGYVKVYSCSYCSIQDIEYLIKPEAYNSGIYGHNYDVFGFGKFAITMGYRPYGEALSKDVIEKINYIVTKYANDYKLNKLTYDAARLTCIYEIEMLLNHVYKCEIK